MRVLGWKATRLNWKQSRLVQAVHNLLRFYARANELPHHITNPMRPCPILSSHTLLAPGDRSIFADNIFPLFTFPVFPGPSVCQSRQSSLSLSIGLDSSWSTRFRDVERANDFRFIASSATFQVLQHCSNYPMKLLLFYTCVLHEVGMMQDGNGKTAIPCRMQDIQLGISSACKYLGLDLSARICLCFVQSVCLDLLACHSDCMFPE